MGCLVLSQLHHSLHKAEERPDEGEEAKPRARGHTVRRGKKSQNTPVRHNFSFVNRWRWDRGAIEG